MQRCKWCNLNNKLYIEYHDKEWGNPVYDDRKLFELLLLESFQAGLSWETILNKRENFRNAFDNFDYYKISNYNQEKIEELLTNQGIIRCKRKITAVISNAKIFINIIKEWGTFFNYIWHFTDNKVIINKTDNIPINNELSNKISYDLKKRGMKYVGTTIIYSYLQAIGVINDHELNCFKRAGEVNEKI